MTRSLLSISMVGLVVFSHAQGDTARVLEIISEADQLDSVDHSMYHQAIQLAEDSGWEVGVLKVISAKGVKHETVGSLDSARFYYLQGVERAAAMGDQVREGKFMLRTGVVYRKQGLFDRSFKIAKRAYDVFEKAGDAKLSAACLNDMAISLKAQGHLDAAIDYYKQALSRYRAMDWPMGVSNAYINLTYALVTADSFVVAQLYADSALSLSKSMGDQFRTALSYSALVDFHREHEDFETALLYVDSAKTLLLREGDKFRIAGILAKEGGLHFRLQDYQKSRNRLEEALTMARDIGSLEVQRVSLKLLHRNLKKLGEFELALKYYEEAINMDKNLYSSDIAGEVNSMRYELELEQKEKEKAQIALEKEKVSNVNKQQKLENAEKQGQIYLLITIALALIIISGVLVAMYRRRRRLHDIDKEISQAKLESRELLLGEIHHRVKNNLQLVVSMLDLQSRETSDDQAKRFLDASRSRVEAMALIHQRLYQTADYQAIESDVYIANLVNQIVESAQQSTLIKVEFELESMLLDIDTIVPLGLILNEWITNSVKYAFAAEKEGVICITMKEQDSRLVLSYNDNGSGMSGEIQEGFGSRLVRSLARQLKAELNQTFESGFQTQLHIAKYKRIDG